MKTKKFSGWKDLETAGERRIIWAATKKSKIFLNFSLQRFLAVAQKKPTPINQPIVRYEEEIDFILQ